VSDKEIARKSEIKQENMKMVYRMLGTMFRVHFRVHPRKEISNKIR